MFLYVHMIPHGYKLIENYNHVYEKYYIEYRTKKFISHHSDQTAMTASMSKTTLAKPDRTMSKNLPTYYWTRHSSFDNESRVL